MLVVFLLTSTLLCEDFTRAVINSSVLRKTPALVYILSNPIGCCNIVHVTKWSRELANNQSTPPVSFPGKVVDLPKPRPFRPNQQQPDPTSPPHPHHRHPPPSPPLPNPLAAAAAAATAGSQPDGRSQQPAGQPADSTARLVAAAASSQQQDSAARKMHLENEFLAYGCDLASPSPCLLPSPSPCCSSANMSPTAEHNFFQFPPLFPEAQVGWFGFFFTIENRTSKFAGREPDILVVCGSAVNFKNYFQSMLTKKIIYLS